MFKLICICVSEADKLATFCSSAATHTHTKLFFFYLLDLFIDQLHFMKLQINPTTDLKTFMSLNKVIALIVDTRVEQKQGKQSLRSQIFSVN